MDYLLNFHSISLDKVRLIFEQQIDPHFEYHNLRHTFDVLAKAEEIGTAEGLDPHELALVKIAALFHDTGFAKARKNHEEQSIKIFLESSAGSNLSLNDIEIICGCIRATRMPQNPQSLLGKVICDADLDYLGRPDFFEIGAALYREMLYAKELTEKSAWNSMQLAFLENHHYKTEYSKLNRIEGIRENINLLKKTINREKN